MSTFPLTFALLPLALALLVGLAPWFVARAGLATRLKILSGRSAALSDGTAQVDVQPEAAVIVELLVAGLQTGAGIPRTLQATGRCLAGEAGQKLTAIGTALLLGSQWDQAWELGPGHLKFLARALRPAWEHGAPPTSVLEATRLRISRQSSQRTEVAAQRLTVHLVLPLGLCYLPSFILLGVVPILFSLGGALLFPR